MCEEGELLESTECILLISNRREKLVNFSFVKYLKRFLSVGSRRDEGRMGGFLCGCVPECG